MNILAVTSTSLQLRHSGYDLRVAHLCRALAAAGHRLHLLVVPLDARPPAIRTADLGADDIFERVDSAPSPPPNRHSVFRHLRASEADYYRLAQPAYHRAVLAQMDDACRSQTPDRVIFFGSNLIGFRSAMQHMPHLVDVCDSVHLTLDRHYAATPPAGRRDALRRRLQLLRWQRAEGSLARGFKGVAAISPADAARLRQLNGGAHVAVIPNGVDAALLGAPRLPAAHRRGVVFWGNLGFAPNAEALRFYYDEVHRPHLAALDVKLTVIGANAPSWLQERARHDTSLRLMGFVDDLPAAVGEYPVMIAPLISGSGLKNKVLEAFALRLAVVATPMAVEAIAEAADGVHFRGARHPGELAQVVRHLLDDTAERQRLTQAARSLVDTHYTWEGVGKKWCHWVESIWP